VVKSRLACDDNYQRMLRRRNDPSLLLAAKARMNIAPPVVNAANLKSPGHLPRLILSRRASGSPTVGDDLKLICDLARPQSHCTHGCNGLLTGVTIDIERQTQA
jgi:hypothetical protein